MTAKYPLAARGHAFTQSQCKQVFEVMGAYFPRRTWGCLIFGRGEKQQKFKSASKNCYKELGLIRIFVTFSESPMETEVWKCVPTICHLSIGRDQLNWFAPCFPNPYPCNYPVLELLLNSLGSIGLWKNPWKYCWNTEKARSKLIFCFWRL